MADESGGDGASGRGDGQAVVRAIMLPEDVSRALVAMAARHGVAVDSVIQGAWAILLGAYANEDDIVFGLVRSQTLGWGSTTVVVSLAAGAALIAAFIAVERRITQPMLPLSFFARRSFAVTNVISLAMYFGMFGSIFFLSQFLQNVLGNSPLQAGLKLLASVAGSAGSGAGQRVLRQYQLADLVAALDDLHQLRVPVRPRGQAAVLAARRREHLDRRGGASGGMTGADVLGQHGGDDH